MLGSLDDFIDSLNPVSSPVIDLDPELSLGISLNNEKSLQMYESSFFDDDNHISMSSDEEILQFMPTLSQNSNKAQIPKPKKVVKTVVFHPFTSICNTEVTVQNLKRFFKQPVAAST